MSIYIVSHKRFDIPKTPDGYIPFFVGVDREMLASEVGIMDGTGDNIAELNGSFCELTALYWIWRNDRSRIKGLVHYRRMFLEPGDCNELLSVATAQKLLDDCDVIVPQKYWLLSTVAGHYSSHHSAGDLKALEEVMKDYSPEYIDAFRSCLGMHFTYPYNMMVSRSSFLDAYCSWLFPILFELARRIKVGDGYQSRVFGFLSERMLNAYIIHNGLTVSEVPVLLTEKNLKRDVSMGLGKMLSRFREK